MVEAGKSRTAQTSKTGHSTFKNDHWPRLEHMNVVIRVSATTVVFPLMSLVHSLIYLVLVPPGFLIGPRNPIWMSQITRGSRESNDTKDRFLLLLRLGSMYFMRHLLTSGNVAQFPAICANHSFLYRNHSEMLGLQFTKEELFDRKTTFYFGSCTALPNSIFSDAPKFILSVSLNVS